MRLFLVFLAACLSPAVLWCADDWAGWSGHGSIWLLTDNEGANLPDAAVVRDFPVLLRLRGDSFPFESTQAHGEDLRITDAAGRSLALQIETWDKAEATATVWVRVPEIRGNARQELKLHWGNAQAKPVSDGSKVFARDNGYLSVWHLGQEVKDEVGTLSSKVVGTRPVPGMIGEARSFAGKEGIFGGDKIPDYPTETSSHTTSAWIKAARSNTTIIGWGNEAGGRGSKVRFQLRSPMRSYIDSNFANVEATEGMEPGKWYYVTHTYDKNDGRLYLNGRPNGQANPTLTIKSPARLWIGGWYHDYSFEGLIDEVRVSSVARSPEWVKLEYENQRPIQTLAGHVVTAGSRISLVSNQNDLAQGQVAQLTASVPGALSIRWYIGAYPAPQPVAEGVMSLGVSAPKQWARDVVTMPVTICAVLPRGVIERSINLTWRRVVPAPVLQLPPPQTWDGRSELRVKLAVTNLAEIKAQGDKVVRYDWRTANVPVIAEKQGDEIVLKRALGSGLLTLTASFDGEFSGSAEQTTTVQVTEPSRDAWVARPEPVAELPQDGQFYARGGDGLGELYCKGALTTPAQKVTLKVFADDKLVEEVTQVPLAGQGYRFKSFLKPGLIRYRVELSADAKIFHTATDLVCGDVFIIQGQSNAVATDFGKDSPPAPSPWVRSFGSTEGGPTGARLKLWGAGEARGAGGKLQLGYWAVELGRRLVETQKIPICFLNGAVGGTRIDQHQRDLADPTNPATIYGRLLWRVQAAGLAYGVRGILWHQGENDQGADGPDGTYGYVNYRKYFEQLAGSWRQDYPNAQQLHLFQIWPKSCSMGSNGSDNALREEQRRLKTVYTRCDIIPTLGIRPPGGCHFPAAGYAEFAKLMAPLIERDHYGVKNVQSVSAPNLLSATWSGAQRDTVVLTFDQPVLWRDELVAEFSFSVAGDLDEAVIPGVKVVSGTSAGTTLTLKLAGETKGVALLRYLDSKKWSQDRLLMGANGLPALTFWGVPIQ